MKCPARFKEFTSDERHQECQLDCALLLNFDTEVTDTHYRNVYTCGLLDKDDRRNAVNRVYGEWRKRGGK